MKSIQLYQCEICGIQYKDKDTAINCEMLHRLPIKIIGYKYLKNAELPTMIEVEFQDGQIGKYKR